MRREPGVQPAPSATAVAVMLGLAVGWTLTGWVSTAAGGAIPDSSQMSTLRAAAAKAPVLLVRGDFGLQEIRKPLLDSTGVRSATWESQAHARPAVFTAPDPTHAPAAAPIAWSEISTIHTQHQRKLQGAIAGFVVGLAVSAVIYASTDPGNSGEDYGSAAWVLGAPMLGVIGGFAIGSFTGTRLVYPKPIQETP